jgi:hypothetical protein
MQQLQHEHQMQIAPEWVDDYIRSQLRLRL